MQLGLAEGAVVPVLVRRRRRPRLRPRVAALHHEKPAGVPEHAASLLMPVCNFYGDEVSQDSSGQLRSIEAGEFPAPMVLFPGGLRTEATGVVLLP